MGHPNCLVESLAHLCGIESGALWLIAPEVRKESFWKEKGIRQEKTVTVTEVYWKFFASLRSGKLPRMAPPSPTATNQAEKAQLCEQIESCKDSLGTDWCFGPAPVLSEGQPLPAKCSQLGVEKQYFIQCNISAIITGWTQRQESPGSGSIRKGSPEK